MVFRGSGRNGPGARSSALLVLLLAVAGFASAGEFKVSPILQSVAPGETMATYRVANAGEEPVTVQISAFDWQQRNGERRLQEASGLLVVPPITTIRPGEEQLVRLALQGGARSGEVPFRVQFEEIPRQSPKGSLQISTALRIDVPLFFSVENASAEVDWRLTRANGKGLVLRATNNGSSHARYSALILKTDDGRELAARRGPTYLLAGKQSSWHFPDVDAGRLSNVTLAIESGLQRGKERLTIE